MKARPASYVVCPFGIFSRLCTLLFILCTQTQAFSFKLMVLGGSTALSLCTQAQAITAFWDFNESSGSTLYDLVGTNNGTLFDGSLTYDGGSGGTGPNFIEGRTGAGNSLSFNMTNSVLDDSVQCSSQADFAVGQDDFTLTGWFKVAEMETTSSQHGILFSDAIYNTSGFQLMLYRGNGGTSAGKLLFEVKSPGAVDNRNIKSSVRLDDNMWHWFAAVVESRQMTLYVDGVKQGTQTYGSTTTAAPAKNIIFGSAGVVGQLDDVAFFRSALDGTLSGNLLMDGPLYRIWKQTPINAEETLIACWNFNEFSGSTLFDSAGLSDGTLYDDSTVYDGGSGGSGPNFVISRTNAGNALEFNLNSFEINDSVQMNNQWVFNFEHNSDFTVSGWFKADLLSTNSSRHGILFSDSIYNVSGVNIMLYRGDGGGNAGKFLFEVKSPEATNNCSLKSTARLDDSEWHWFASVVRSQTMYLYVDGEFIDLLPYGLGTTATPAKDPVFGTPGLIGALDDFSIFNYAVLGNKEGGQLYNLWADGPLSVTREAPPETGLLLSTNTTGEGTQYYDMWDASMPTSDVGAGYPILTNAEHNLIHYATANTGGYNHKAFITYHDGCFYTSWANHRYGEDSPGQHCLLSISSNATEWSEFKNFFAAPDEVGGFNDNGLYFSPKAWRICDSKLYGMVSLYESAGWENADGTSFSETHDAVHYFRVINKIVDIAREVKDSAGQLGTMFALQDIPEGISLPFTVLPPDHPTICDATELLLIPEEGIRSQCGLPVPIDDARLCEASYYGGANGDWVCLVRDDTYSHRMYSAWSDDQGVTWSAARPTNIPDSPSLATCVTLTNGTLVLIGSQCATAFDNPTSPKHYGRDPLVISTSTNGYVFSNPLALRTGQQEYRVPDVYGRGGGAQCPSALAVSNKLYVAYSMGKEDIFVSVVDLDEIVP